jgi:hypothetical protein
MAQLILKAGIVEEIQKDPVLFGKVAEAMGLSVRTMFDLLPKNPPRLATASVLAVLKKHKGVLDNSELLEEVASATA